MPSSFPYLPATNQDLKQQGLFALDVVLVTGDANVDHPSFPAALLGRVLESAGFSVGIISRPQPDDIEKISCLGLPRLFFGVTAGSLDSMVANYTALKKRRSNDPYAPGGKGGGRPDRALTAYCNLVRRAFGKQAFIVAGGLEASLRRFAHYDYWSDKVRRPILMDCGADILVYGMGEGPIVEIAKSIRALRDEDPEIDSEISRGSKIAVSKRQERVRDIPGVVYRIAKSAPEPELGIHLPSAEKVAEDPAAQLLAHMMQTKNQDELIRQDCAGMRVVANRPWPALTADELDAIYALPYTRNVHPVHKGEPVPALEQVRFSITSHRGCFGGCAFCGIGAHQGKTVTSRSTANILLELKQIVSHPEFRGTIRDLGGPSANMYKLGCTREKRCERPSCLWPAPCKHLNTNQEPYRELLRKARETRGVKHLFVSTGVRTDLAVLSEKLVHDLAAFHTSGLMKVAPEHVSPDVLDLMRKPMVGSFLKFLELHQRFSTQAGKNQFVLPYIMAAHPGSRIEEMGEVYRFLRKHRLMVEQCQIFTPTPGTAAAVMYSTGMDPATGKTVYVEKSEKQKQSQKILILHHLPENRNKIAEILQSIEHSEPPRKDKPELEKASNTKNKRRIYPKK